jgi:hypothetical protein
MVKHTLHFYMDGELIDYTIHYEKQESDNLPEYIRINRTIFHLRSNSYFIHSEEKQMHIHADYHGESK